ncbi:tRNA synthetases class I-domain-containing protein [Dimargaris cristalligena]|uniref:Isoleucine--tRNA ligase, mitochondrial n=1 Tax=Dimargaris cristalligena TaxID=215637 RepID=A0A4P9ZXC4_9FUNG|nr:tRNA synthetases class I-domain-containing protein [Dimargaris cristalligena]|eukprot:RKP38345.1 tRNA synthetases class I-domain-containing protein [Dimargaris cristalligena]
MLATATATTTSKQFHNTLLLPHTDFPQRPQRPKDHVQRQTQLTQAIYRWQKQHLAEPAFVLHDGPPYANGDLHIGHALNRILKDMINRYQVHRGRKVHYVPGWDCHGLPIEVKALAQLRQHTPHGSELEAEADPTALDPRHVRTLARRTALKAVAKQRQDLQTWGVLADWDDCYRTLDLDYQIRQLEVFGTMVAKGLIYRRTRPVYWSPSSRTALAEAELEYKEDHRSESAYVRCALSGTTTTTTTATAAEQARAWGVDLPADLAASPLYALVWTTTPWTLPANRAIAVHPKLAYALFEPVDETSDSRERPVYLAATARLAEVCAQLGPSVTPRVLATVTGSTLLGTQYHHPITGQLQSVIAADYVTEHSGTGLVHTAPGHGLEDYEACLALGIPAFSPVNGAGRFTAEAGSLLEGKSVLEDGGQTVLDGLKQRGLLLATQTITHSYPYDWRTKQPVIQRATPQWFADLSSLQAPALKAIQGVQAVPESSTARLERYVANRKEWCISRQRAWGVPIPVLYDMATDEPLCDASTIAHIISVIRRLESVDSWWTQPVEVFVPPAHQNTGRTFRLGSDTMDVWFDSGTSWTLLQAFRANEAQQKQSVSEPLADVYLEGSDQHRGWFQSSLLTSIAVTGRVPFRRLVTHGFTLDGTGRKMSKSLGNTMEPNHVIQGGPDKTREPAYGTDTLRLWVASTDYTRDVVISPDTIARVAETVRKFRHTARFMLGNLDAGTADLVRSGQLPTSPLDRYALAELRSLVTAVTAEYDALAFNKVFQHLTNFTNAFLSAFYFEIIKDRLYTEAVDSPHRQSTQIVLHHILRVYTSLLGPITHELADEIFRHHRALCPTLFPSSSSEEEAPASVLCTPWPTQLGEGVALSAELAQQWQTVRRIREESMLILEQARRNKHLARSLEVELLLFSPPQGSSPSPLVLPTTEEELCEIFLVSNLRVVEDPQEWSRLLAEGGDALWAVSPLVDIGTGGLGPKGQVQLAIRKSRQHKCPRCWRYCSATADALCTRCDTVVRNWETRP